MSALLGIKHGIVSAVLGCGFYTVEKGLWSGSQDAAGVDIGYEGNGVDDCDICFDVSGEGTDACGITLSYPPCMVTGTGEFVTAYDEASALIPLVVGTSCKIVNMGDNDTVTGDSIWQVIRGVMQHIVKYDEEWDCCDGAGQDSVETLISRTPNILIGRTCQPISCGSCY